MKLIGKQVCFLPANGRIKRNGEGAFLRLKDGRILFAYTEYDGASNADDAHSYIAGIYSDDEGETWGGKRSLMFPGEEDKNIMSVSLLRMKNGDVGLFFLRKTGDDCRLNLSRSSDEGQSFKTSTVCYDHGYYVTNNDRIVRLRNGTIIAPANRHKTPNEPYSVQEFFVSRDDGNTWQKLPTSLKHPFSNSSTGLQEGGIYEMEDGTLWNFARTRSGSQYMSFSHDGGNSWTEPCGSELFTGPDSPLLIQDVGPYAVAVFNPKPRYYGFHEIDPCQYKNQLWGRSPLVCLVSRDHGTTFPEGFLLEDDPTNAYCYPAVFAGSDYFLVAYYHSNGSGKCLTSCKIKKVMFSELQDGFVRPMSKSMYNT